MVAKTGNKIHFSNKSNERKSRAHQQILRLVGKTANVP